MVCCIIILHRQTPVKLVPSDPANVERKKSAVEKVAPNNNRLRRINGRSNKKNKPVSSNSKMCTTDWAERFILFSHQFVLRVGMSDHYFCEKYMILYFNRFTTRVDLESSLANRRNFRLIIRILYE